MYGIIILLKNQIFDRERERVIISSVIKIDPYNTSHCLSPMENKVILHNEQTKVPTRWLARAMADDHGFTVAFFTFFVWQKNLPVVQ